MPLFNLIFLGLGWPWVVGEFDGFIKIVICFPTQQWLVYRRHPKKVWASQRLLLRFARCRLVEYGWGGRIESVGHKVIIAVNISLLLLLLYLAMRVVLAYPCRMVCYHTITPPPRGGVSTLDCSTTKKVPIVPMPNDNFSGGKKRVSGEVCPTPTSLAPAQLFQSWEISNFKNRPRGRCLWYSPLVMEM